MADEDDRGLPVLPHVASEFYSWVWWASEQNAGVFKLDDPVGRVDVWVDERLAFRNPEDTRVSAVMTGENPSATIEARAALAGGKVLQDLRLGVRRDDREYFVTLKGAAVHLQGLKLPQVVKDGDAELVFERLHLYDEATLVVGGLFRAYAAARNGGSWDSEVLPSLRSWILGRA
ncbi:MAG: hypothetical protein ACI8PZ_006201 [Myxococcota bacterium]|jgi:hypothetical protein